MDGLEAALCILKWASVWSSVWCAASWVSKSKSFGVQEDAVHLYANRLASFLHSSYLCVVVFPVVFFVDNQGIFTMNNFGGDNTVHHERFLEIVAGWMVFDIGFELLVNNKTHDLALYAHHVVVLVTSWFSLTEGRYGPELAVTTLMSELTTPFLSLKFVMKYHKLQDSQLSMLNDAIFAFGFLILRIGWGSVILRYALASELMHTFVRMGGISMTIINWIWAYGIARKMHNTISEMRNKDGKSKCTETPHEQTIMPSPSPTGKATTPRTRLTQRA